MRREVRSHPSCRRLTLPSGLRRPPLPKRPCGRPTSAMMALSFTLGLGVRSRMRATTPSDGECSQQAPPSRASCLGLFGIANVGGGRYHPTLFRMSFTLGLSMNAMHACVGTQTEPRAPPEGRRRRPSPAASGSSAPSRRPLLCQMLAGRRRPPADSSQGVHHGQTLLLIVLVMIIITINIQLINHNNNNNITIIHKPP